MTRTSRASTLVVALCGSVMLLFLLLPLLTIIGRGLFDGALGTYLAQAAVTDALRLSLITTAATLAVSVVFGTPVAYLLARRAFRGRTIVDTLIDLPMVLPPAVAGVALLVTFGRRGIIGGWLDETFNISIGFTTAAVILAQIFVAAPFYIKAAKAGFESVDVGLEAVAATLGAGGLRTFWRITLPLALPSVLSGIVMTWARALGEFGATIMFAGSFQGRTRTMPLAIYAALEGEGGLDEAITLSVILVAVSFAVLLAVKLLTVVDISGRNAPLEKSRRDAPPTVLDISPRGSPPSIGAPLLDVAFRLTLGDFRLESIFGLRGGDEHVLVLFGASGSGKSLTLRAIAGLLSPHTGYIAIGGRRVYDSDIGEDMSPQARRVGYVPQHYGLFPHLSVADNIGFGLFQLTETERTARVRELLGLMRLDDLAQRRPSQISGGQQQRVALARALAVQPDVLLLDEPFSALDAAVRRSVREEVRDLARKLRLPMVVVTHDLDEAYSLADRIAVFERGRVVQHGAPDDIINHPATRSVAEITGTRNIVRGIVDADCEHIWLGGLRLPLAYPHAPGSEVLVAIRPERIVPVNLDADGLPARVVARLPQPQSTLVRVMLADGVMLEADVPQQTYRARDLDKTDMWNVSIAPDALHIIADEKHL